MLDLLLASASEMGEQWFDEIGDRFDTDVADQLQSPKLAKELQQRWPEMYRDLEARVKDIRTRGKALEKTSVRSKPIRSADWKNSSRLQQELVSLQNEIKSVQKQIGELPQQIEADRQAVLAARQAGRSPATREAEDRHARWRGLTQTLLGKPVTEGLASALEWVRWARDQVSSGSDEQQATRSRGTTVVFTPPQADLVVELLKLEGDAQLNGQPLQLTGTLKNASSAPSYSRTDHA